MDVFFSAPEAAQSPHSTRSGPCDLPIHYRDASHFGAFFRVELSKARQLVGPDRVIEPWPILGRAVAAIYVWEYRDSSVGSYREVGLGIQCRIKGKRPSVVRLGLDMGADDAQGIWVLNLPVTTQAAHDAGVDLWGYPKYVTPIETRFQAAESSVTLGSELTLSLPRPSGPTLAGQPVVTYTERQGRLIRTRIDVDHRARWGLGGGARLSLEGEGPLARSARALGLDGLSPVAAFRVDGFRARLPVGVDLGPARMD